MRKDQVSSKTSPNWSVLLMMLRKPTKKVLLAKLSFQPFLPMRKKPKKIRVKVVFALHIFPVCVKLERRLKKSTLAFCPKWPRLDGTQHETHIALHCKHRSTINRRRLGNGARKVLLLKVDALW
jgi:hypothetical protein